MTESAAPPPAYPDASPVPSGDDEITTPLNIRHHQPIVAGTGAPVCALVKLTPWDARRA